MKNTIHHPPSTIHQLRTSTTFEAQLLDIIDASLEHAGYHIIQLRMAEGQRKGASKSLQLIAERADGTPMSVADCESITHTASALLDVKDPIEGNYDLEVASPGLERPLVSAEDFKTYQGVEVKIELNIAQNGQRRFKGSIADITDDVVTISDQDETFQLPISAMKSAHLVATEAMVRELMRV